MNRSIVLVILGDGFLTKKLKGIAKSKRLTGRVFFHPAVSQKDLLFLTATADAGVIPYQATCLNNYYCTPNKMFEFIAAGIPILASDLPEIRNVVIGQRIGSVGDMSTTRKFAALIDDFFADKQRFDEWRQNLVETRKQICWEVEGKKFVKILEDLV